MHYIGTLLAVRDLPRARRFYDGGMTPAQVAKRMDVPQEAVDEWLAQTGGQA